MTRLDPIIAVKDIETSSEWYKSIFGWRRTHGGNDFGVLVSENDEVLLCLHKWGADEHPTMRNRNVISGNGLILYYKSGDINLVRKMVSKMDWPVEKEIHLNSNSTKMEFSLRDPDGYYLTITEYHEYEG